jgi:hypothetical protein
LIPALESGQGAAIMAATRTEYDTFGPIEVPADRLWGAQTQRSRENFAISGEHMPTALLKALAIVKKAAALVNQELGTVDAKVAQARAGDAGLGVGHTHSRAYGLRSARRRPDRAWSGTGDCARARGDAGLAFVRR